MVAQGVVAQSHLTTHLSLVFGRVTANPTHVLRRDPLSSPRAMQDGGSPVMKPTAAPSKEVFSDKAVEKDDFDMFG